MTFVTAKTRTRFQNILFATDFSHAFDHAIPFVKRFARQFDSNVVALHVRTPAVNPMTYPSTWKIEIAAAEALDNQHREQLSKDLADLMTKVELDEGNLRENLDEALQKYNIDLVVMGTRGRGGIAKAVLGSATEEILRTVQCPVLAVGPNADCENEKMKSILFATDLAADASAPAAAYALSLAQEFQANLALLYVSRESPETSFVTWLNAKDSAKRTLKNLIPEDAEAWCKADCLVERGDPVERILELAAVRDIDLIVLGAKPEAGFPGASTHLPFTTVHKIIAEAKCPVMTVRSGVQAASV